jgi:hypothetical protein
MLLLTKPLADLSEVAAGNKLIQNGAIKRLLKLELRQNSLIVDFS